MRKLSATAFGSLLCIGTACAQCATQNPDYFLEGGSNDFVIRISFERKTLLEISQLHHLKNCPASNAKLCFVSNALTFSSEPSPGAMSWTVDGLDFKAAGNCISKPCRKLNMDLKVIHSSRYGNEIDFYYNEACGLMGWTTTYPGNGSETFMRLPPQPSTNPPATPRSR